MSQLTKENKEVYICGDFNFDLLNLENNHICQEFYNLLCSYGFLPKIIQPSRITDYHTSLIDNIFSNNLSDEILSGNILLTLSEHFSRFVSVRREKIDFNNVKIYQRDYFKFDNSLFRDDVSIQKWGATYENVNNQFNDLFWELNGCVERHAPIKELSPKEIKMKSKPWITPDITKLIRNRNKLFKRKKIQPNNENIKALYNQKRNQVNREIKRSKNIYYVQHFEDNSNNIKKISSGIREIVNLKNTTSPKVFQLNVNGKTVVNLKEIASNLNNFFVNIGPSTESNIPKVGNIYPAKFMKDRQQFNFIIAHISEEEVLGIINALENKSTGPTSIPTKLLKMIPDLIILPLCRIINMSFINGVFPDNLKIVKVIPVHKGGSTQDMNNFRPVSLLSIFDKIMEKLMHKRLYDFLENNNILFKNQFGFRKNNSTICIITNHRKD